MSNMKKIAYCSAIAAVYAVLTLIAAPISYGPVQIRISEALTVLPAVTPLGIYGVFIGCLIANIFTGSIIDIIFGSLTTLFAAVLSYLFRKNKWLVPLPPVVLNALIVGYYLSLQSGVKIMLFNMLTVGAGQLIACYALGLPLLAFLRNNKNIGKFLK